MEEIIGFTGTSQGMTKAQFDKVAILLSNKGATDKEYASKLHHGDCIGADAEAHRIAGIYGLIRISHPPVDNKARAFCMDAEIILATKPYLERNHDIVDTCQWLIATPKEFEEELRSGTWATVRYAKKIKKPITIVWPDRSVEEWKPQ